ncbi:MAG TPA: response regulator, partial [Balneolaceae bacterium]|nr:response regulator [Balneolaceae bacterium]
MFINNNTFTGDKPMGQNLKGRVLIVEDDMLLSMVEERLIKRLGFDVVGKVTEAEDAVNKTVELKPDVIIMDISLKGDLDGIDAMEMIRQKSDVPVIYLSGSSDRYYYERAKKTGFSGFLTKPVTSGDLEDPLYLALKKDDESVQEMKDRK